MVSTECKSVLLTAHTQSYTGVFQKDSGNSNSGLYTSALVHHT